MCKCVPTESQSNLHHNWKLKLGRIIDGRRDTIYFHWQVSAVRIRQSMRRVSAAAAICSVVPVFGARCLRVLQSRPFGDGSGQAARRQPVTVTW